MGGKWKRGRKKLKREVKIRMGGKVKKREEK